MAHRTVSGPGFGFAAPAGWKVEKTPIRASASPPQGEEVVSVSIFRLARAYTASLWPKVVRELDHVASELAVELGGSTSPGSTVTVAGLRGRSYLLSFTDKSGHLVERVVFLLRERREFELLCRWSVAAPEPGQSACRLLLASFRPR